MRATRHIFYGRVVIGTNGTATNLEVVGTARATAFIGNGAGLSNLSASAISGGSLNASVLPTNGVWNASGMTISNVTFQNITLSNFPGTFSDGGEAAGKDRSIGNTDSNALSLLSDGQPRLTVAADGHVGIGTTNPTRRLVVQLDNESRTTVAAFYNSLTNNRNGSVLSFRTDTSGSGGTNFKEYGGLGGTVIEHDAATSSADVFMFANEGSNFNKLALLVLKPDGNVGIGYGLPVLGSTNTFAAKLDVNGTIKSTGLVVGGTIQAGLLDATVGGVLLQAKYNGAPAQAILTERSSGGIGLGQYMYQSNSATWLSSFSNSIDRGALFVSKGTLKFISAPVQDGPLGVELTNQPTTKFFINTTGNVGIGTVTPSQKLDVDGTVKATGIIVGNGIATGAYAVAIGSSVVASNVNAFAAGSKASAVYSNTFVWSDGTAVTSSLPQEFTVHAKNGIRLLGGPISGNGYELTNINLANVVGYILTNGMDLEHDPLWVNASNAVYSTIDLKQDALTAATDSELVAVSNACLKLTGGAISGVLIIQSNLVVGTGSALGKYAVSEGRLTVASGDYSHAEGDSTVASGNSSHAEGANGTTASEWASHAEGDGTVASGMASHAEGAGTTASGSYSHAEGAGTTASGFRSHAEGSDTIASGVFAHAEGFWTTASGSSSHAAGQFASATNDYTYVWNDGTDVDSQGGLGGFGSTTTKQFSVYAANGIRLLGGPISGDGSGLTNLPFTLPVITNFTNESAAEGSIATKDGKIVVKTAQGWIFTQDGTPVLNTILIPSSLVTIGNKSATSVKDPAVPLQTNWINAVYMDQYEVTQEKWAEVYNWAGSNGYTFVNAGIVSSNTLDHPVRGVSWYDCVKWANALSEKSGLTPCYTLRGAVYRSGKNVTPVCNWMANGYRLPTEAEWEKAARGGLTTTIYPWATNTISTDYANYAGSDTMSVGSFTNSEAANGYGLYDLAGNVREWCWNAYRRYPKQKILGTDPKGPASGATRVVRGGSFRSADTNCTVSDRGFLKPVTAADDVGFRLVKRQL